MQISPLNGPAHPESPPKPGAANPQLMAKAKALEAAFLSEMLGHAGLGAAPEGGYQGGIGEEQFSSFLRQQQAKAMVARGGIGLAEQLFAAMTRRAGA